MSEINNWVQANRWLVQARSAWITIHERLNLTLQKSISPTKWIQQCKAGSQAYSGHCGERWLYSSDVGDRNVWTKAGRKPHLLFRRYHTTVFTDALRITRHQPIRSHAKREAAEKLLSKKCYNGRYLWRRARSASGWCKNCGGLSFRAGVRVNKTLASRVPHEGSQHC